MVNNVIEVVNYVIAARPSLLNFVIADNCVNAHVSIAGRQRRHHRPESSRQGAEEYGVVLERGHEDAITGREE